jgi:hypothetical protein
MGLRSSREFTAEKGGGSYPLHLGALMCLGALMLRRSIRRVGPTRSGPHQQLFAF